MDKNFSVVRKKFFSSYGVFSSQLTMPPEPARVIHRAGSNDELSRLEKYSEPAR